MRVPSCSLARALPSPEARRGAWLLLALALHAGPVAAQASPADPAPPAPEAKPGEAAATTGPQRISAGVLVLRGLREGGDTGRAVSGVMAAVQRRTAVEPVIAAPSRLSPTDPALFDTPLLVLSGSSGFDPLSDREVDALRTYLTSGGMLFADDASGVPDSAFARAVRAQISRVLGGRPFEALPPDHAAFRSFYLVERAVGRVQTSHDLEAIRVNGRAAVILSLNDVLGACERDAMGGWARPVEPGGTRQREEAIRLGVNLVLYALTLDYKEDLVHLPMILERKR